MRMCVLLLEADHGFSYCVGTLEPYTSQVQQQNGQDRRGNGARYMSSAFVLINPVE